MDMSTTKPRVSKDEYKAQKQEEQREMLAKAVEALTTSEGWQRYLDARAKFYKYSFNNLILIAMQRPDATQVMGAGGKDGKTGWKSLGRRVLDTEYRKNSIKILAPSPVYLKENGKVVKDDKGKPVIKFMWYRTVEVYDVSQTEGDPLPEPTMPEPLTGESHEEYLYRAQQYAEGLGFTVEYTLFEGDKRGDCNLKTKKIRVHDGQAVNAQARTMIHELCHADGEVDYANYTREQAEVIVENATYIICKSIGLDTEGMSVPYIANWGSDANDPKAFLKIMRAFAAQIDGIVNRVTEAII